MTRPSPLRRLGKGISGFARRRVIDVERWIDRKSLVATGEIIPSDAFPWVAELEANWRTIRQELDRVLVDRAALPAMQDISRTQYGIVKDAKVWKVYPFQAYGARSEHSARQCPQTARLLARIPDLEVAFFSVLDPGAHLSAHRGSYRGLIRAHLGLIVPEPRSALRMQVGAETIHWEEGKCVVFDDTYRHEVWNDADGIRVVLLIDVARPFPPLIARINKTILRLARLTPFVTEAIRNMRAWEREFYGAAGTQTS